MTILKFIRLTPFLIGKYYFAYVFYWMKIGELKIDFLNGKVKQLIISVLFYIVYIFADWDSLQNEISKCK